MPSLAALRAAQRLAEGGSATAGTEELSSSTLSESPLALPHLPFPTLRWYPPRDVPSKRQSHNTSIPGTETSIIGTETPLTQPEREIITNGQRCGFYAGIASLVVSPVIIILAVLYFVRRRRAQLRRKRASDAKEPRDSLEPYTVDVVVDSSDADERDPKHVLDVSGEKAAAQNDGARQSTASSLDDPEKLVALRRVMRQAGFTVDAMVACLGRVARISSSNGALSPVNPPPMYER
ncbi:hypothetical protein AURDEDRAFT_172540 [Auricularia subglabra TFB-10046 SS5]|nr:hypothetical protein AURDEDRAFT_172540 [Auricularia subglabra TFB-10046 SS5]